MAQKFKEVAHLRTDLEKYGEGYDRIFKNKTVEQTSTDTDSKSNHDEKSEMQRIKELARRVYSDLESGQDTEGFPESSSFIYGFVKGYQASEGRKACGQSL
jgi:hypothetical protein